MKAEEREAAVMEMLGDCREGAPTKDFVLTEQSVAMFIKRTMGRLYDKGYRKQNEESALEEKPSSEHCDALRSLADAIQKCDDLGLSLLFQEDQVSLRAPFLESDERIGEYKANRIRHEALRSYIAEKLKAPE